MGTKANLKAAPCQVLVDVGAGLVDIGYTKGGLKLDITPKTKEFTVDQLGETPAIKVLDGCEAKISFSLAEYLLTNIKLALANGVALQDDTTSSKKNVTVRPKVGQTIPQWKWQFKPIDPATGLAITTKDEWITVPAGQLAASTFSLMVNGDSLRLIPINLDAMPWEAGTGSYKDAQVIFGDDSAIDANESGF